MREENRKGNGTHLMQRKRVLFLFRTGGEDFSGLRFFSRAGHEKDINNNYNVIKLIQMEYLSFWERQIISSFIKVCRGEQQ